MKVWHQLHRSGATLTAHECLRPERAFRVFPSSQRRHSLTYRSTSLCPARREQVWPDWSKPAPFRLHSRLTRSVALSN